MTLSPSRVSAHRSTSHAIVLTPQDISSSKSLTNDAARRFSAGRDSKAPRLLPVLIVEHNQSPKLMACDALPRRDLVGRDYMLKLCSDPSSLRQMVPNDPGFPSRSRCSFPHRVQPTCQAQVVPFRAPLDGDLHPFRCDRISLVSVLRTSPIVPCPRRPFSTSIDLAEAWIGSKQPLQVAAPVAAGRAQLRASGYGVYITGGACDAWLVAEGGGTPPANK